MTVGKPKAEKGDQKHILNSATSVITTLTMATELLAEVNHEAGYDPWTPLSLPPLLASPREPRQLSWGEGALPGPATAARAALVPAAARTSAATGSAPCGSARRPRGDSRWVGEEDKAARKLSDLTPSLASRAAGWRAVPC